MTIQAILDSKNNIVVTASPYHVIAMDGYDAAMASLPFKKKPGQMSMDDGIAFYISQLAGLDPKIYQTKYRNIRYQELIPIDTSGPAFMDQFDYISYDAVTIGKFIGANAKDMPNVAMKAKKDVIKVEEGGIGYGYSLQELEKSQAMNMPLDATGARAADRGFQEHAQRVAFKGDTELGVTGLLNNVNIAVDNAASTWAVLGDTAAGMLAKYNQLNSLLIKVWEDSAQVHIPSRIVLPTTVAADLTKPMAPERPEITLAKYFAENNFASTQGVTVKLVMLSEMETAGVGATRRMMAYEVNAENLVMKMPRMLEFLPPQPEGLRIEIPGRYKFGGVEFRYPGCAAYRDAF